MSAPRDAPPSGPGEGEPLPAVFQRAHAAFGAQDQAQERFDASGSPLRGRVAFIVAAPRSGTTWLQQMLSAHPEIATSMESHLVPDVIRPLLDNHAGEPVRLGAWISRHELVAAARRLADDVFQSMLGVVKPGARLVLEKSPSTHVYASTLAEVFPDASYVHLVRDGRHAALSAHRMWPKSDEYGTLREAARRWRVAVEDIQAHLGHLQYLELRYEDLRADAPAGLRDVLGFLGLEVAPATLEAALGLGSVPVNARPQGRAGAASAAEEAEIVAEAGELLRGLGYADSPVRPTSKRRRPWSRTGRAR